MRNIFLLSLAVFCVTILGCAIGVHILFSAHEKPLPGVGGLYVRRTVEPGTVGPTHILDVPFYESERDLYCSEASASMVLAYFGYEVSQDNIHVRSDRFENMLPFLLEYLDCELLENFGIENLKEEVSRGWPVMIRILPGKYRHTVVIVGYDENYLYVHDPDFGAFLGIDPDILWKVWEPTGFAAITCRGLGA
jgi:hypothetical protein